MGDDEGEVVEELHVEVGGVAGGEADDGGGADEGGEEGEEEVIAELGGAGDQVVVVESGEGALEDDEGRDALEIPEVVEGGGGDLGPDALAHGVVRGVVFAGLWGVWHGFGVLVV